MHFGPYQIKIEDKKVFKRVDKILRSLFKQLKEKYPSCLFRVLYKNRYIEHPTRKELDKFLAN